MSIFADEVSMRSNTPSVADLVSATISLWAPLSYSRSTISMIDVVGSSAPAPIGAYVIAVFKHLGSARHYAFPFGHGPKRGQQTNGAPSQYRRGSLFD
jgi:hypothetical protein